MLEHLAGLILNRPQLVTPQYAETVMAVLSGRVGVDASGLSASGGAMRSDEQRMIGSTMVIPITGSLTHRPMGINAMSGVASYASMQSAVEDAMSMSDVRNILLDYDSPGGMVSGAFDFRDYLMSVRGRKPMYAVARDTMASAAFLLGSTADKIFVSQEASVGSVGVIYTHVDRSQAMENQGVKPTFIYAGDRKIDGNPAEPLSAEVQERIQNSVDATYGSFVAAIAEARGMSEQSVRDTQAGMFTGQSAVDVGFADAVGSLSAALSEISATAPRSYPSSNMRTSTMTEEEKRAAAAEERARISAITTHASAAGRPKMANHLAFNTQMSAEDAIALLSVPEADAVIADPVDQSAELAAALAENAALKEAAASEQSKALSELAKSGSGVSADSEVDGDLEMSAEDQATERARMNARKFFKRS